MKKNPSRQLLNPKACYDQSVQLKNVRKPIKLGWKLIEALAHATKTEGNKKMKIYGPQPTMLVP